MTRFPDRTEAGKLLAERLAEMNLDRSVVLALPRGGVPVAAPIAERLDAPLDVILVRKIGVPGREELAAGAVVNGANPQTVFNDDIMRRAGLTERDLAGAVEEQLKLIAERRERYLEDATHVPVEGCTVIVVDDGIATGATARAALLALRRRNPAAIVLAVPVAPHDALAELEHLVDRTICLATPAMFQAVGAYFEKFDQTGDEEVVALLRAARDRMERSTSR